MNEANMNGGGGIMTALPPDILRSIRVEKESVFLVWGGDEPHRISVHGQAMVLPPRDVVADPRTPGSIYRFPSAKGKNGKPIPGTLELQTVMMMNPKTRAVEKKFDAMAVLDFLTGEGAVEGAKKLVNRGLLALRRVEDVERVLDIVHQAYVDSVRESDEALLRNERERQKSYLDAGENPPPSPIAKKIEAAARRHTARERSGDTPGVDLGLIEEALGIEQSARTRQPAKAVAQEPARPQAPAESPWPAEVVTHLLEEARSVQYRVPSEVLMGLAERDRQAVRVLAGLVEEARQKAAKATAPEEKAKR